MNEVQNPREAWSNLWRLFPIPIAIVGPQISTIRESELRRNAIVQIANGEGLWAKRKLSVSSLFLNQGGGRHNRAIRFESRCWCGEIKKTDVEAHGTT